jgi:hypothetical protein
MALILGQQSRNSQQFSAQVSSAIGDSLPSASCLLPPSTHPLTQVVLTCFLPSAFCLLPSALPSAFCLLPSIYFTTGVTVDY